MSQMNWRHNGFCKEKGSYLLHHSRLSPTHKCNITLSPLKNFPLGTSEKAFSVFQVPLLSSGNDSTYSLWFSEKLNVEYLGSKATLFLLFKCKVGLGLIRFQKAFLLLIKISISLRQNDSLVFGMFTCPTVVRAGNHSIH